MFLLVVQLLVPLALLAALALRTPSRLLKLIQAAAVFLYLATVHRAGLWLQLPWWTPWLLWAGFALALALGARPSPKRAPSRLPRLLAPAAWSLAAAGFGWLAGTALIGRTPPPGPLVPIASPLPPGRYLVVNGGSRGLINAHLKTLHPATPRQAAHRGQSYGLDIVGLTRSGRSADGWQPRQPERHAIFGTPVAAPCAGQVVARLDGRRDMPVPVVDQEVMAGNHVVLRCGEVHIVLAHLRRGSVVVQAGQRVGRGARLGEVGNSGNSDAPHLHLHAQRPGRSAESLAGDPLPVVIDGRYLVRGDQL